MTRRHALVLAIALSTPLIPAQAQTELSAYADKNGYVNVQKLTCGQLAGTFQEDANFLGIWYSGWYNGPREEIVPSICPGSKKAFMN